MPGHVLINFIRILCKSGLIKVNTNNLSIFKYKTDTSSYDSKNISIILCKSDTLCFVPTILEHNFRARTAQILLRPFLIQSNLITLTHLCYAKLPQTQIVLSFTKL